MQDSSTDAQGEMYWTFDLDYITEGAELDQ